MTKQLTQGARKKMVQDLIDSYKNFEEFLPHDLDRFIALANPTEQIAGARKQPNAEHINDPRHMWFKIDGEWQNRSWLDWVEPSRVARKWQAAMRKEIEQHMHEYRDAVEDAACERCGSTDFLQVDHIEPPFIDIANKFIEQHGVIELADGPPGAGKIMADRDLAGRWEVFHASYARYQILCRSCNASKGKRRPQCA